jgi:hypothetical protein
MIKVFYPNLGILHPMHSFSPVFKAANLIHYCSRHIWRFGIPARFRLYPVRCGEYGAESRWVEKLIDDFRRDASLIAQEVSSGNSQYSATGIT